MKRNQHASPASRFLPWKSRPQVSPLACHRARRRHGWGRLQPASRAGLGTLCSWLHRNTCAHSLENWSQ